MSMQSLIRRDICHVFLKIGVNEQRQSGQA